MRRFVCLVLLMAFFCVSALAENASVRGLEYGMTVSEIMEVERNKRNNEPTNFTDTSVKYEGIDVNGEIADVRYSIEDGYTEIRITFPTYDYSYEESYLYSMMKDLNLSNGILTGDFEDYSDIDPALEEIIAKVNSTYTNTKEKLTANYGEPIACMKNGNMTTISAGAVEYYKKWEETMAGSEYGERLANYDQWLKEYDDCLLAIDLCSIYYPSLMNEEYWCCLRYRMYDKTNYNLDNMELIKKEMNDDF